VPRAVQQQAVARQALEACAGLLRGAALARLSRIATISTRPKPASANAQRATRRAAAEATPRPVVELRTQ